MALSEDAVMEKLKNVIDPELFVNIVDLGLIYEVNFEELAAREDSADNDVSEPVVADEPKAASEPPNDAAETTEGEASTLTGKKVKIDMTMTSPACPAGPQLIAGAQKEVGSLEGVSDVEVKIVLDPPWTPDRMTEDAKDQLGIF